MSTREEFEKWWLEHPVCEFTGVGADDVFAAWKAARAQALEDAAIAAWSAGMDEYGQYSQLMDPRHVGSVCAKRIRALAKENQC